MPPGPIILTAIAVIVALVRWRWIPVLGFIGTAFVAVGMVAAGTGDRLRRRTISARSAERGSN